MKLTVFKSLIFSCLFLTAFFSSFAQASLKPLDEIDVLHYHFYINVNDTTDVIEGNASIKFELLKQTDYISFNLDSKDASGLGMEVLKVLYNNKATRYKQNGAILTIKVIENDSNDTQSVSIFYKGIPKDGLIISKNMFGDRTFFGDNWPNRAHYWLPCLDALADKAYVDFYVTAPNHYRVVANGSLVEKDNLLKDRIYTHWKSSVVLPTDVMVVGIARFEVQDLGIIMGVPVSSWVFPQNKEAGFIDYAVADKILAYYIKTIDEYPYKKLANVQSKTRFGGMENASAIFYFEKSVNGKQDHEDLLAHEIAHQWFGDSATETDWPHLWLSEGFATYFTNLYLENTYGKNALDAQLIKDREKIITFSTIWKKPVVDHETTNLMDLLNANSYEKGSWFLHMLRRNLGDSTFAKAYKTYYKTFKFKNADTQDFKTIVQQVSGRNLDTFFNQWLYQVGQPKLNVDWRYQAKTLKINISQVQDFKTLFNFPLSVKLLFKDQTSLIKTLEINQKIESFEIPSDKEIVNIILDPNTDLLFDIGRVKHP